MMAKKPWTRNQKILAWTLAAVAVTALAGIGVLSSLEPNQPRYKGTGLLWAMVPLCSWTRDRG